MESNMLQSLLSTTISCTISLKNLLQVRPHICFEVVDTLVVDNHHPFSWVFSSITFQYFHMIEFIAWDPISIRKLSGPSDHILRHTT